MVECNKENVKLWDTQLNNLKSVIKNQTGATLRINLKMFNEKHSTHELLLTTRQKTEFRNSLEKSMSTDIKLSSAQISKITKSDRFLGSLLSKMTVPLMKVVVPLARNILAPLEITAAASENNAKIQ